MEESHVPLLCLMLPLYIIIYTHPPLIKQKSNINQSIINQTWQCNIPCLLMTFRLYNTSVAMFDYMVKFYSTQKKTLGI
jgi:hypothetical protein